jgi:hypothetical protein
VIDLTHVLLGGRGRLGVRCPLALSGSDWRVTPEMECMLGIQWIWGDGSAGYVVCPTASLWVVVLFFMFRFRIAYSDLC